MLLPRYSLRWLLGLTTVAAAASVVLAAAVRGKPWAIGVAVSLASLVLLALLHSSAFLLAWCVTRLSRGINPQPATSGESPFAAPPLLATESADDGPPSMTG